MNMKKNGQHITEGMHDPPPPCYVLSDSEDETSTLPANVAEPVQMPAHRLADDVDLVEPAGGFSCGDEVRQFLRGEPYYIRLERGLQLWPSTSENTYHTGAGYKHVVMIQDVRFGSRQFPHANTVLHISGMMTGGCPHITTFYVISKSQKRKKVMFQLLSDSVEYKIHKTGHKCHVRIYSRSTARNKKKIEEVERDLLTNGHLSFCCIAPILLKHLGDYEPFGTKWEVIGDTTNQKVGGANGGFISMANNIAVEDEEPSEKKLLQMKKKAVKDQAALICWPGEGLNGYFFLNVPTLARLLDIKSFVCDEFVQQIAKLNLLRAKPEFRARIVLLEDLEVDSLLKFKRQTGAVQVKPKIIYQKRVPNCTEKEVIDYYIQLKMNKRVRKQMERFRPMIANKKDIIILPMVIEQHWYLAVMTRFSQSINHHENPKNTLLAPPAIYILDSLVHSEIEDNRYKIVPANHACMIYFMHALLNVVSQWFNWQQFAPDLIPRQDDVPNKLICRSVTILPSQGSTVDCGLFVLKFLELICQGKLKENTETFTLELDDNAFGEHVTIDPETMILKENTNSRKAMFEELRSMCVFNGEMFDAVTNGEYTINKTED